jgi:ferredoxin
MAEIEDKLPDNIGGRFYVDVCRDMAPSNFKQNRDNGYSFVYKQPENEEERQLCEDALAACPVEAIGDDGA